MRIQLNSGKFCRNEHGEGHLPASGPAMGDLDMVAKVNGAAK
ncbi:hypothetical protein [Duganella vulcania]|nr:hypothetical protein [Duganella vulcania]